MKVKRYVGETVQEAMQKVKSDLGRDAIILNTRKIRKKGLTGFFAKPLVEVVATIDNEVSFRGEDGKHQEVLPREQEDKHEPNNEANKFIKELNEKMRPRDDKNLIQQDFIELKNMLNKVCMML